MKAQITKNVENVKETMNNKNEEMVKQYRSDNDMSRIDEERLKWEQEKERIKNIQNIGDEVVELNVGGTHNIMVKKSILTKVPGSDLANLFSGRHKLKLDENKKVFLDRDGRVFENVISYLRNNLKISKFDSTFIKDQFELELKYWKLPVNSNSYKSMRT